MSKLKGETHESGAFLTAVPLFFLLCRALLAKRIDQLLVNDMRRGHRPVTQATPLTYALRTFRILTAQYSHPNRANY